MSSKMAWCFTETNKETGTFAGGAPYGLAKETWPRLNNRDMCFLFQVNLSEVDTSSFKIGDGSNAIELPSKGFLQFFTNDDDLYGTELDGDVKDSVIVVKHIDETVSVIDEMLTKLVDSMDNFYECERTPLIKPNKRVYYEGSLCKMPPAAESLEDRGDGASEFPPFEFYLGGNPYFTQEDFRDEGDGSVLFLGSISGPNIMWGDMGAAGFWKSGSVDYLYWDCY